MTKKGKESAMARREAEAERTRELLEKHARLPFADYKNGSIRTYVWGNYRDRSVPVLVEHLRVYSTISYTATTRGLEASDLVHVLKALDLVEHMLKDWGSTAWPPLRFSRDLIAAAIDRGDNPPKKVFVCGNVAALIWMNPLEPEDFVPKVELLSVIEPNVAERFFRADQIGDARKCIRKADAFITAFQAHQSGR